MKRTRLRSRSKTNSHRERDEAMRREYLETFPECELKWILHKNASGEIDIRDESADPHHVVGGNGRRFDRWSNLLTLCRSSHDWVHANPPDGRIVCLWKKMVKAELRPEEFREIHGMYLAGWLDIHHPRLSWVEPLWQQLVEHVGMVD